MKKVLWAFLIGIFLGVFARVSHSEIYEYPRLFRDSRFTAMGGVGVAVGGSSSAVFHNPAGLSLLPRKHGFEVRVLDVNFGFSENILDFVSDMQDALDVENDTLKAINDVFRSYLGENFAGELNLIVSIAKRHEYVAWTLGVFGRAAQSGMVHQGFGTAGVLDVDGLAVAGAFLGFSTSLLENRLHVGADVKALYLGVLDHTFRASEIADNADNFTDYVTDEVLIDGGAITFDVGLILTPFPESLLDPAIGFSVMNITDLDVSSNDTEVTVIPRTYNVGIALRPRFFKDRPIFKDLVVSLDVMDITKNLEEDEDWGKRIYVGGEVKVWDHPVSMLALRGGFYQGYPAFGFEFRFLLLSLQFVSYAEEVGAYAGQMENRRYLFNLALRW